MTSATVGQAKNPKFSWSKFVRSESGSITSIFAFAMVPLVAAAGAAIDYNRVVEAQSALHSLADRAALAAAAFDGSGDEQKAEASRFIDNNDVDLAGVSYTPAISVDGQNVRVVLDAVVEGTLLPVALAVRTSTAREDNKNSGSGDTDMTIAATAKYLDSDPGYVCLLTTNTTADDAIFLSGTRTFEATGCGIHSDSNHPSTALHLQGNRNAFGDFFHSVGGWSHAGGAGYFSETPVGGKSTFGDPFNLTINCPSSNGSSVTPGNGAVLSAASYTDITIQNNRTVTFSSGIHYIFGTVDIKNGGTLVGNNVTLVLCGPDAHLDMNGGVLQLQAPATGTYAGFAIVGDDDATHGSELQGGPSTYVRGIWYTPKAKLEISGNSDFNVDSSYFPVIADTFYLNGSGSMTIKMDFEAYGFDEPTQLVKPTERSVWLVD